MVFEVLGMYTIVQQVNVGRAEDRRTEGRVWVTLRFRGLVGEKQVD